MKVVGRGAGSRQPCPEPDLRMRKAGKHLEVSRCHTTRGSEAGVKESLAGWKEKIRQGE